jgi:Arginase family
MCVSLPDSGTEDADCKTAYWTVWGVFLNFAARLIQIDSIDPAFAPATGTPETGGWSTRELRTILRGLDGLHIVSADIVEVAPAYDTNAELTTMAAADVSVSMQLRLRVTPDRYWEQVLFEVLSVMAKTPLGKVAKENWLIEVGVGEEKTKERGKREDL